MPSGSETVEWSKSGTTGLSFSVSDFGMTGLSVPISEPESDSSSSAEEREWFDPPSFSCCGCLQWGKTEAGPDTSASLSPMYQHDQLNSTAAMHEAQKQESCLDAKIPGPKIHRWWIFLDPGTVDSIQEFTILLASGRRKQISGLCADTLLYLEWSVLWHCQWSNMSHAFVTVTLPLAMSWVTACMTEPPSQSVSFFSWWEPKETFLMETAESRTSVWDKNGNGSFDWNCAAHLLLTMMTFLKDSTPLRCCSTCCMHACATWASCLSSSVNKNKWLPFELTTARGASVKWNNWKNSYLSVRPVSTFGLVLVSAEKVICKIAGNQDPALGKICFERLELLTLPLHWRHACRVAPAPARVLPNNHQLFHFFPTSPSCPYDRSFLVPCLTCSHLPQLTFFCTGSPNSSLIPLNSSCTTFTTLSVNTHKVGNIFKLTQTFS